MYQDSKRTCTAIVLGRSRRSRTGFAKAPSTVIRFQTKTELFCYGYSYRPHYNAQNTENGAIRKMADRRYHVASLLIGVVVWTGENDTKNDKCGRKSFWKRGKTASCSFENGLMWTAPKTA